MDESCPLCGGDLETIEHLFFQCELAKRLWRASHLGINFDVGPILFGDWFKNWITEAPSKELVWDSIFILWVIWCIRNEVLFRHDNCNVDNAFSSCL